MLVFVPPVNADVLHLFCSSLKFHRLVNAWWCDRGWLRAPC